MEKTSKRRLLIIVTSNAIKKDRFIKKDTEWSAWGFDDKENFKWRFYHGEMPEAKDASNSDWCDLIVWMKTDEILKLNGNYLEKIINTCEIDSSCIASSKISVAYHDLVVKEDIIRNPIFAEYCWYDLFDKKRFDPILKYDSNNKCILDNTEFDLIYACFFLYKKQIFKFVFHKLNGFLASLDIDLQGLIDSGFNASYWKEIQDSFQKKCPEVGCFYKNLNVILKDFKDAIKNSLDKSSKQNLLKIYTRHESVLNELTIFKIDYRGSNDTSNEQKRIDSAENLNKLINWICSSKSDSKESLQAVKNLLNKTNCFRDWHEQIIRCIEELESDLADSDE